MHLLAPIVKHLQVQGNIHAGIGRAGLGTKHGRIGINQARALLPGAVGRVAGRRVDGGARGCHQLVLHLIVGQVGVGLEHQRHNPADLGGGH